MAEETPVGATVGARLAERLADVVTRATVDTRTRLAATTKDLAVQVFTDATNHISDEVREVAGDLFATLARDPNIDPALQPLLHNLAHKRGQAYGWIGGAAMGTAMGAGLMDLVSNWLAEPIGAGIAGNPRSSLSPEQTANLVARNRTVPIDLQYEAAKKGINEDRLAALVELHQSSPPIETVLTAVNRNYISPHEATFMLQDLTIRPEYHDLVLKMAKQDLTPEQLAAGWARNLVTPEQVYHGAGRFGLVQADTDILMGLAGEPPPLEAIIQAWRRGILTEADVDRAIIQGPLRNEWIPTIKALQTQPLPPEVAAAAVTQGHLSLGQGQAKAALSGITEADFSTIVETAGLPPGIEWAAEAFNREIITDDEYTRMFLESRIKNRYIAPMKAMRTNLIPADTVRLMYRNNTYTAEQALKVLRGHGFSEVDAAAMLALEDVRRTEGTRELTRAQIVQLFDNDILSDAQARGMLTGLGYGEDEVDWMLALTEVSKVQRFVTALVTRVRAGFLAGNIDAEQAAALMDEAGVGAGARDAAISLWTLELEALSANLTVSQIQQAMKRGLLTDAEAADRFTKRGYTERDAQVLVSLARPASS